MRTPIITVMMTNIVCPTNGGKQTDSEFNGEIECRRFDQTCTTKMPCFDIAKCVEKKYVTYNGFDGSQQ